MDQFIIVWSDYDQSHVIEKFTEKIECEKRLSELATEHVNNGFDYALVYGRELAAEPLDVAIKFAINLK